MRMMLLPYWPAYFFLLATAALFFTTSILEACRLIRQWQAKRKAYRFPVWPWLGGV